MMKKFSLLLFLSLLCFTTTACTGAKDNSNRKAEAVQQLTSNEKLVLTAKVWGFLKYYHPQVARGKYNWDEQLFSVLEKVEQVHTSEELSGIFTEWIAGLGEVPACTKCFQVSQEKEFLKNLDLSWLDSESFSRELREQLTHIKRNRVQDSQHYVAVMPTGNILVQNEPEYEDFQWEEKELRLLSLFRYWNQVEYFFPYKYQMDQDWDETLSTMLPKFLDAGSEQEYHLAMLELTASTDDSHAFFVTHHTNSYFGYHWAPVILKMIDGKAVVTGIYDNQKAAKDDWQLGDILTAVEGVPVSEIIEEDRKYLTGSNDPARFRGLEINLLNGSSASVEIEILRDNKNQRKQVSRYLKKEFDQETPEEPKWEILEGNVGYVGMGILENGDIQQMMQELGKTRAIIFDIRNYPKGTMYNIAFALNSQEVPFVKFTLPDLNFPGKFTWTEPLTAGTDNPDFYKGKVILLVNELTQSHAEFSAMALQTAPDVTVIGSQTAGADGNVSNIALLGKFRTFISGIGVFYPDGRETQRVGIVPDIEVKTTLEGILQERDEVLEKALEVATEKDS